MDPARPRPESLAAYLARIRPGDRCACCGAIFQPLQTGLRRGESVTDECGRRAAEAVICMKCGCEISEEVSVDTEADPRRLNPAA